MRTIVDNMFNTEDTFLYPFNLFLKDLLDNYKNKDNEDAAFRYCRLFEMMVKLQNKCEGDEEIDHKVEHFVLRQLQCYLNVDGCEDEGFEDEDEFMYLLL
ncbi:hypothetical protein NAPIS_ORF01475 [Vairimorpha apis BRL 01]|uniref:Uncharacterized protein n=1 Tax=Vairimorpha apis BRL 01 TaxID=1037528 RepID=T0L8Y5_9MICR|nr:hypothetical protein NAPIS_ORF01475 [Vairimorpha apis BRL 01]